MQEVISVRELQRNYRKIIDKAKRTKLPLFLGRLKRAEVAILDMGVYNAVYEQKSKRSWEEIQKSLNWIKQGGEKKVNLAKFIKHDRQAH